MPRNALNSSSGIVVRSALGVFSGEGVLWNRREIKEKYREDWGVGTTSLLRYIG